MSKNILDFDADDFQRMLANILDDLSKGKKLAEDPLLESLVVNEYRSRNQEYSLSSEELLYRVIGEIIDNDVMPKSVHDKATIWRAAVVLKATYLPIEGEPEPRRSYTMASGMLFDPMVFAKIVPRTDWEQIMQVLNFDDVDNVMSELMFYRALTEGRKLLAVEIIKREESLAATQSDYLIVPQKADSNSISTLPSWFELARETLIKSLGSLIRANGSNVSWEQVYIPRYVEKLGDVASQPTPLMINNIPMVGILGHLGSGRTTTLRYHALSELLQFPDTLVAWVDLLDYAKRAVDLSLRDYVLEFQILPCCKDTNEKMSAMLELVSLDNRGQLIFYLDDWDKLSDSDRSLITPRIRSLMRWRIALGNDVAGLDAGANFRLVDFQDKDLELLISRFTDRSENIIHNIKRFLNREASLRQLAYRTPLAVDILCDHAMRGQLTYMQVVDDLLLTQLERIGVLSEMSPKILDALSDAFGDFLYEVNERGYKRNLQDFIVYEVDLVPCIEKTHHTFDDCPNIFVRAGILENVSDGKYKYLNAVFANYFLARYLARTRNIHSSLAGLEKIRVTEKVIGYAAVSKYITGGLEEFIRDITGYRSKIGLERIWAADVIIELNLAGHHFVSENTLLEKVRHLADADSSLTVPLIYTRALCVLHGEESAIEYLTGFVSRLVPRVKDLTLLDEKPTVLFGDIYEIPLWLIASGNVIEQWLGRVLLKALLDMKVSDSFESLVSKMGSSPDRCRDAIQPILARSDNWLMRSCISSTLGSDTLEMATPPAELQIVSDRQLTMKEFARLAKDLSGSDVNVAREAVRNLLLYRLDNKYFQAGGIKRALYHLDMSDYFFNVIDGCKRCLKSFWDTDVVFLASLMLYNVMSEDAEYVSILVDTVQSHPSPMVRLLINPSCHLAVR